MSAVAIVMLDRLPVLLDPDDLPLIEGQKLTLHSDGYVLVGRDYLHQLVMQTRPGEIVHHINGLRADCRRLNLRKDTKTQNGFNAADDASLLSEITA